VCGSGSLHRRSYLASRMRAELAGIVEECAERWSLRLGDPFPDGNISSTYAATTEDGRDVVLKVQVPHHESDYEAEALRVWDGDGAVRLLDDDPERHALLLERCVPGTMLAEAGQDAALDVLIGLLPRLWKPVGAPFRSLAEEAAWWVDYLPRTWRGDRDLLDAGLQALRELAPTQGEQVLLHQDLHCHNVLAAGREPWLVIDPKPLAGEREFAVAPIVRSFELGDTKRDVLHRFDRLTAELGLDRERARGWAIGQTVAWAEDSAWHVRTARWLLEAA
jgi:streptomycin 6-kinase